MRVDKSQFLLDKKPVLKKLIQKLAENYPYVSILGTDVAGKVYQVKTTGTSVQDSDWTERGFVLRVHNGQGYFEYSFNQIDERTIEGLVKDVKESTASISEKLGALGLNYMSTHPAEEEESELVYLGEVDSLPENANPGEIVRKLSKLKELAHEFSNEVVSVMTLMENVKVGKLFISGSRELCQSYVWSQGYLYVIARRGEKTKYALKGFSGLKGSEILDEMESEVKDTVAKAVLLLDADRIEPGLYDVICSPDVAGLIAHEAFGHGVEMDMFLKGRAKAVEYLGREVASELVTMHDGAVPVREVASYAFDDEGVMAQDTLVIDRGILKSGISDTLSAAALGQKSTGNGRRESFERKAYARMTNTYFSPGKSTLDEMVSSLKYGYLLEDYYSGMEDPKNWGIQCVIAFGREIKDGKYTGKIVSPVMMTGYVPTLLKSISMVSNDFRLSGTGACGKGHKEFVKVSAGGPYIKTKARLG